MAIGDTYVDLASFKTYVSLTDTAQYDGLLAEALADGSEEVERLTKRQFNDSGSASPRVYRAVDCETVFVDDFHTTTGLIVETDTTGDGTFDTTWTLGVDFEVRPLNGIRNGRPGWPYWEIGAIGTSKYFPSNARASVRVTARWGWAEVPKTVEQACKLLAAKYFQLKDAPLGVAGGGEFGAMRVGDDRLVMAKLARLCRNKNLVA